MARRMRLFLKRLGCLALLFSFLLALPISMEAADQKATKDRIKATFIGSAVVVTYQPSGWTEQEAEQYIRKLQKLREDEELSQAGVPPTPPTSRRGLYGLLPVWLTPPYANPAFFSNSIGLRYPSVECRRVEL